MEKVRQVKEKYGSRLRGIFFIFTVVGCALRRTLLPALHQRDPPPPATPRSPARLPSTPLRTTLLLVSSLIMQSICSSVNEPYMGPAEYYELYSNAALLAGYNQSSGAGAAAAGAAALASSSLTLADIIALAAANASAAALLLPPPPPLTAAAPPPPTGAASATGPPQPPPPRSPPPPAGNFSLAQLLGQSASSAAGLDLANQTVISELLQGVSVPQLGVSMNGAIHLDSGPLLICGDAGRSYEILLAVGFCTGVALDLLVEYGVDSIAGVVVWLLNGLSTLLVEHASKDGGGRRAQRRLRFCLRSASSSPLLRQSHRSRSRSQLLLPPPSLTFLTPLAPTRSILYTFYLIVRYRLLTEGTQAGKLYAVAMLLWCVGTILVLSFMVPLGIAIWFELKTFVNREPAHTPTRPAVPQPAFEVKDVIYVAGHKRASVPCERKPGGRRPAGGAAAAARISGAGGNGSGPADAAGLPPSGSSGRVAVTEACMLERVRIATGDPINRPGEPPTVKTGHQCAPLPFRPCTAIQSFHSQNTRLNQLIETPVDPALTPSSSAQTASSRPPPHHRGAVRSGRAVPPPALRAAHRGIFPQRRSPRWGRRRRRFEHPHHRRVPAALWGRKRRDAAPKAARAVRCSLLVERLLGVPLSGIQGARRLGTSRAASRRPLAALEGTPSHAEIGSPVVPSSSSHSAPVAFVPTGAPVPRTRPRAAPAQLVAGRRGAPDRGGGDRPEQDAPPLEHVAPRDGGGRGVACVC